jgi:uncharacterized RDD family membrane protein YckC
VPRKTQDAGIVADYPVKIEAAAGSPQPAPGNAVHPAPVKPVDIVIRSEADKAPAPDVRKLIDRAVTRQPEPEVLRFALSNSAPDPADELDYSPKLILLSRTLSGLIDFLIVLLCTVAMVIVEDAVSTIEVFDLVSLMNAGLLFISLYLLYSLFFLGTANQTIGMMITRLRIVSEEGKRPALGQVVGRCFAYFLSVVLAGAGLIWGLCERRSRCLHDLLSRTHVEPLG